MFQQTRLNIDPNINDILLYAEFYKAKIRKSVIRKAGSQDFICTFNICVFIYLYKCVEQDLMSKSWFICGPHKKRNTTFRSWFINQWHKSKWRLSLISGEHLCKIKGGHRWFRLSSANLRWFPQTHFPSMSAVQMSHWLSAVVCRQVRRHAAQTAPAYCCVYPASGGDTHNWHESSKITLLSVWSDIHLILWYSHMTTFPTHCLCA